MFAFSFFARKARSSEEVHTIAVTSDPLFTLTVALLGPVDPDVNEATRWDRQGERGKGSKHHTAVFFRQRRTIVYINSSCM